jgi:hypothetical protein
MLEYIHIKATNRSIKNFVYLKEHRICFHQPMYVFTSILASKTKMGLLIISIEQKKAHKQPILGLVKEL